jgi:hypothetical protein
LAGDGVEVEGGFVARNGIGLDAEEIEEERAILCGGEGNEIAAASRIELGVDLLNVGGLTAQRGAAIHDLKTEGAFFVVDAGHGGRGINPIWGSAKKSGEFTGDEGDLIAEAGAGFALMENADGDFAGEAEGKEATARIEREGFSPFDADERGEAAKLAGDVWGLLLEGGGFRGGGIGVAENAGAVEANAGAEAGLGGEELDDARSIESVLDAEEGTEQELIGVCIQSREAEEGGFARGSRFGLGREGRGGRWRGSRCGSRGSCWAVKGLLIGPGAGAMAGASMGLVGAFSLAAPKDAPKKAEGFGSALIRGTTDSVGAGLASLWLAKGSIRGWVG